MKLEAVVNLLSNKEREIYFYLLSRLTLEEISREIGCSYHNVKFHCSNIYYKCKVKNRMELATTFNDKNIPLLIFQMKKEIDELKAQIVTQLPTGKV